MELRVKIAFDINGSAIRAVVCPERGDHSRRKEINEFRITIGQRRERVCRPSPQESERLLDDDASCVSDRLDQNIDEA